MKGHLLMHVDCYDVMGDDGQRKREEVGGFSLDQLNGMIGHIM